MASSTSFDQASACDDATIAQAARHELTDSLLRRAHGRDRDEDAVERRRLLEQVVVLNMGVARSVARRYRGRGIPQEDLEQVAHLALVRCAMRWEPERERDFLSYLVPSVRGEVRRYFRDHGWMVKPPRRVQELQPRVVAQRNGGDATPSEIASQLGVETSDVEEALRAEGCFTPKSLDAALWESHTTAGDMLSDPAADRALDAAEARLVLTPLVATLSPRDRELLHLRFFEGRSQQEIADEWGVTQPFVSRALHRILTDLRVRLETGSSGDEIAGVRSA